MGILPPQPENVPEPASGSDDVGLRPCLKHPKEMTRLTCTHCEAPICPKCMIACEVGFKCKQCTTKTHSHLLKGEPRDYLLGGAAAFIAGMVFGSLSPMLSGFGYLMMILCFFIGRWTGDLIHRAARYKFAPWMIAAINASLVAGLFFSPLRRILLWLRLELTTTGGIAGFWHYMPLISAVIFVVGVQFAFNTFRRR